MDRAFDIGFLGGGQLARMSIQAAQRMGLRCLSYDADSSSPAGQVAPAIDGALRDPEGMSRLIQACERVTLENEFIPASVIAQACELAGRDSACVLPGLSTLELIQDKLRQRLQYASFGVPGPRACAVEDAKALASLGLPVVLKSRFGGYDGKGVRIANDAGELASLLREFAACEWMAEEYVPFAREVAVMVFGTDGNYGAFPTMETVQSNHVCDLVFPTEIDASEIAISAVRSLSGSGLFGVELFALKDGSLMVNEVAPRPHNTGHYTMDWGGTSQFEQHVRLVMGWPTDQPHGLPTCMANLLGQPNAGDFRKAAKAALEVKDVHMHWYGKLEARPGRKMGHINATGEDCVRKASEARDLFCQAWTS